MWRFTKFVLLLVVVLAIFPLYTRFKVAAAPVPPGVYLGDLSLSNLKSTDEIRQHLEQIYLQPVDVRFGDERVALMPAEVGFRVDAEQMVAEAGNYLEGTAFLDIAVREALGFDQQRRDVPVRFMLDHAKMRTWLEQLADEYNHPPASPRLLPPTVRWAGGTQSADDLPLDFVGTYNRDWDWAPGRPGQTLRVEESIPVLVEAITSAEERTVHLLLDETPAPPPNMDDLAREINSYLMNFPGFGAAYVYDLQTGAEAAVDADVAFSGMSTLKIAIAAAIMAQLPNGVAVDDAEADLVGQWVDYALGESNNYAANQLISFLGDGSIEVGTQRFTAFVRELGMRNTFMQSGYDANVQRTALVTPANQRTDWNTNPDSNLQTTTREMGEILAAIFECSRGQGLLLEVYGDAITPDECLAVLYYMSHNEFQELIWAGLPRPDEGWIVHKHGFAFESHSDVALVWGPTGPYVISIFLYRDGWMDWDTSNTTMKTISRIVWNYFEFRRAEAGVESPPQIVLEPPPGYTKLHDYIKVASTGYQ